MTGQRITGIHVEAEEETIRVAAREMAVMMAINTAMRVTFLRTQNIPSTTVKASRLSFHNRFNLVYLIIPFRTIMFTTIRHPDNIDNNINNYNNKYNSIRIPMLLTTSHNRIVNTP